MDGGRNGPADNQFISFQEFSPINRSAGQAQLDIGVPDQGTIGNLTTVPSGNAAADNLQSQSANIDAPQQPSFWTIEYYQKYFNVSTDDVVERLKRSVIPYGIDNILSHVRSNPDLYGPFWICVTLVFSIAISGNMANYLQTANSGNYHWRYDFHLVSYAATCIFLYAWLLPLALWGALKWTGTLDPRTELMWGKNSKNNTDELIQGSIPLLELLCLYGYSLAIYIPVAFLWSIPYPWWQWTLVAIATSLSGGVLLKSLSPVMIGTYRPMFMAVILGMHLLLAAGFVLYFFHGPPISVHTTPASLISSTTLAPKIEVITNSSVLTKH